LALDSHYNEKGFNILEEKSGKLKDISLAKKFKKNLDVFGL